jgi:hypothetical protein
MKSYEMVEIKKRLLTVEFLNGNLFSAIAPEVYVMRGRYPVQLNVSPLW